MGDIPDAPNVGMDDLPSGSFRLRYRLNGRSEQCVCKTRQEAHRVAVEIQTALDESSAKRRSLHLRDRGYRRRELITKALIPWWHVNIAASEKSDSRNPNDKNSGIIRVKDINKIEYVDEITEPCIRSVIAAYHKEGSLYGYKILKFLKQFLRYCGKQKIKLSDDVEEIYSIKSKNKVLKPHKVLTASQTVTILEEMGKGNCSIDLPSGKGMGYGNVNTQMKKKATLDWKTRQCMYGPIALMYRYGVRPKQLCALNVSDWNSKDRILIFRQETSKTSLDASGSPTERVLPIDDHLAKILDACAANRPPDSPLFKITSE